MYQDVGAIPLWLPLLWSCPSCGVAPLVELPLLWSCPSCGVAPLVESEGIFSPAPCLFMDVE